MAKLAIALFAIFAVQLADFASVHPYSNDIELHLGDIKTEIFDLTLYLENFFPDNHHAISTITWQCHRVAETIQNVVNKLSEESLKHHQNGELTFKQLWFSLQEIHTSLQQIALSTDVTDVSEIKKQLILNIQLVTENLEKMIHVTYVYYPEFRHTLKQILSEFLKEIKGIHQTFIMESNNRALRVNPKHTSLDVTKYTQKILFHWEGVSFENFRWFVERVREIIYELVMKEKVFDEEVDVVLQSLASKLKKVATNSKDEVDKYLSEVSTLIEQLVYLVQKGSQHAKADHFIQKVIYNYLDVVKEMNHRIEQSKHQMHTYEPHSGMFVRMMY